METTEQTRTPFDFLQAWEDFNNECQLAFDAMPDTPIKRRALKLLGYSFARQGYCAQNAEEAEQGNADDTRKLTMVEEAEMDAYIAVNSLVMHKDDEALGFRYCGDM